MKQQEETIEIFRLLVDKQYAQALVLLDALIAEQPGAETWLLLKGRCLLGLEDFSAAAELYNRLIEAGKALTPVARGEAALLLGQERTALAFFQQTHPAQLGDDGRLLAAASAYLCGRIETCQRFLGDYFQAEGDWDEDDPVDLVLQQVLERYQYNDLEQIYLDVEESLRQGAKNPRNRWFSINIPVYELYTAGTPEKRRERAARLTEMLSPGQKPEFPGAAVALKKILQDFAASEKDARFGLESLKLLEESNWSELARLILAMQLEHLKEFAERFGLTRERITGSSLQQIIPLLPLRLALGLMVLYAIADTGDRLLQRMAQEIEDDLVTALIRIALQAFYFEMDGYVEPPA